MKTLRSLISLTLVWLWAFPVQAGDSCAAAKKCTMPVQDCLNTMVSKLKSTGFIGVELEKPSESDPLKVSKVIVGSPAEKAGIQVGDELAAMNGLAFNEKNEQAIAKVKVPGAKVKCTIKHNGSNREVALELVPMPADLMAKHIGEHMLEHATADASPVAKK